MPEPHEQIARRFHTLHEDLHARARREDPVVWDDMPESYRSRLEHTFKALEAEGSITAGVFLNFHDDQPARF